MKYPQIPNYHVLIEHLVEYAKLRCEYGVQGVENILMEVDESLKSAISRINRLPIDEELARQEPNSLNEIRSLRPNGPRRLWGKFQKDKYLDKLEGALLARMAGCTLGAIVEGWSIESMQEWANFIGDTFPPVAYWSQAKDPSGIRYGKSPNYSYTRDGMNGVPVDDDITYTFQIPGLIWHPATRRKLQRWRTGMHISAIGVTAYTVRCSLVLLRLLLLKLIIV